MGWLFGITSLILITILVIISVFRHVLKGIYSISNVKLKENFRITGLYPDWAKKNPTLPGSYV
jgi:hypothetical protein